MAFIPLSAHVLQDVVTKWVIREFEAFREDRPLFIGLNAPQDAGKTTLTNGLVGDLGAKGFKSAAISIDDFYLTRDEQVKLAESHANNPYFQQRGNPGTHDVALGEDILRRPRNIQDSEVLVPRYDKSALGGKGDGGSTAKRTNAGWLRRPIKTLLLNLFDIP